MSKEGSSIASCGEQKLIDACIKTDIAAVRNLLDQGIDVNCKFKKSSPLIQATLSGCFDLIKLLLERGADVSVKSRRGKTAKDYAEIRGRADMVRLLDEVCIFQTHSS
jgi:ankyrin repeat protein